MCGRYVVKTSIQKLGEAFGFLSELELEPRYNIAPSQDVPIIKSDAKGGRTLDLYRWGLIPSWAKDPKIGYRTINARAETITEKASFKTAYKRQRCILPADGFFEWQKLEGGNVKGHKEPFFIYLKST